MKKTAYCAGGVLAFITILLIWGIVIEPRLIEERRWTVEIPALPAEWHDKEIALIADIQIGMWLNNADTVGRIVERVVKRSPAAVLIAGDFIYHPVEDETEEVLGETEPPDFREGVAEQIRRAVELLRPLTQAGIPVYAVLGNHDYAMEKESARPLPWVAEMLVEGLSAIDVRVLRNQAVPITPRGVSEDAPLYVVGIDARLPGMDDPISAFASMPPKAARVVLMHHPDSFERVPASQGPLALAAHTHGGQVRIPLLPAWTWMSYAKDEKIHADGWIDGYGEPGNRLYVTRGIGFSKIPVRINCRPELTTFTLRPSTTREFSNLDKPDRRPNLS